MLRLPTDGHPFREEPLPFIWSTEKSTKVWNELTSRGSVDLPLIASVLRIPNVIRSPVRLGHDHVCSAYQATLQRQMLPRTQLFMHTFN